MRKLILLISFATSAYAIDFTVTTPTSAIGAGTPSRAITLSVTAGPTASSTSFALSDGGAGGTFFPASPITLATGVASTQFVYIAPSSATGTVTLTATATGGIAATHPLALPIGVATAFAKDTFTGTAGAALTGHVPDIGSAWVTPFVQPDSNLKLNGSGGVYTVTPGHASADYLIPTASPAEHDVSVTVTNSNLTTTYLANLAAFVVNGNTETGYRLVYSAGWVALVYNSTTPTQFFIDTTRAIVTSGSTTNPRIAIRTINSLQYVFFLVNGILLNGAPVQNSSVTSGYPGFLDETPTGQTPAITDSVRSNFAGSNVDWTAPVIVTFPNANVFTSPSAFIISGGTAESPLSGAYMRFKVTGTTQIVATVDTTPNSALVAADMPTIKVIVKGPVADSLGNYVQYPANNLASTAITLASGLTVGTTYDVILQFGSGNPLPGNDWTARSSHNKINSLQFDSGATLSASTLRAKRALFFGDSYLQAYFGGTQTGSYYSYADWTLSWPFFVAYSIGAEYSQFGVGTQGWQLAGNGGFPNFPSSWNFYDSTHSKTFTGIDYVFIAQGANDHGQSTATEQSAVTSWISAARTAFGPNTKFFFVLNHMQIQPTAIKAGVAASGDALAYVIDPGTEFVGTVFNNGSQSGGTPTWASPDGFHLTSTFQGLYSATVSAQVQKIITPAGGSFAFSQ